jgi:glycerol-3-phosphate O-acyltransferase
MLGEHVVKTFHTHNTVLSSHLVAYTAFQIIYRRHEKLDLFGVLRLPSDDLHIEHTQFLQNIDKLKNRLKEIHGMGKVLLSPEVQQSPEEIIEHGMKHLGLFHPKRVLFKDGNHFSTDDAKLLYYYHNRLVGYDLDKFISIDG